jgi:hypothetical protein
MQDKLLETVLSKIDNCTITTEDLNNLIRESTPEAIRDRLRRRSIKNATKSHIEHDGDQRLKPPKLADRVSPRRKPPNQQDHGRSEIAHRHSTLTQRRNAKLTEAIAYINENQGKTINISGIQNIALMKKIIQAIIDNPNVNKVWLEQLYKAMSDAERR